MGTHADLRTLKDDDLLRSLSNVLRQSRVVEADLVAHIAEVDARELDASQAAPSMHAYCIEVLHLSEPETALRIHVARATRKHPMLLEMLRDGRLHLSGIAVLAPHLTPANRRALLKRATHKKKREIEELVAELRPRPDVPSGMRRLPVPRAGGAGPVMRERSGVAVESNAASPGGGPGPNQVEPGKLLNTRMLEGEHRPDDVRAKTMENDGSASRGRGLNDATVRPAGDPRRSATMEPLGAARYRVQFTASQELHDKLERLQALMRTTHPDGDLGALIDAAVTEKLERLEAKRLGKTKRPRKGLAETDTSPTSRHIPAAVRRAVWARDGGQCTFRDAQGRRCPARDRLEFHHHAAPFGRGGDHSPTNVRVACAMHNRFLAELAYGTKKMAQYRKRPQDDRVSEAGVPYSTGGFQASSRASAPADVSVGRGVVGVLGAVGRPHPY